MKSKLYHEREGTKAYCPPEWFLYGSYRAEDLTVWSLGILLFDMLSGYLPWDDATTGSPRMTQFRLWTSQAQLRLPPAPLSQ